MSVKNTPKRRPNQPVIPQVSIETWKALLAAADDFNQLAPWGWMHDSQVIGLRHPATGEVLLGSILGRLRQVFALLVYRNETGRRWILNTILNDGDPGGFEQEHTAFEQDLVKVEFVPKRELTDEDKAMLDMAGYSPARKRGHAWPQFRSLFPGCYPWHMTQAEAETLLFAISRVAAVARLMREQPLMWDDHCDGEIGFVPDDFDPAKGALRTEQMEWQPMVAPPEQAPKQVSWDEPTLAQLNKLAQAKGFHLELDVTYAPFPIADKERPRFPMLAMAADRASGFVGGFHLGDSQDRDGAGALGTVLRDALAQLGRRPQAIHVQRHRVETMLRDVAGRLEIPVGLDEELGQLNFARRSMEQHFNRPH